MSALFQKKKKKLNNCDADSSSNETINYANLTSNDTTNLSLVEDARLDEILGLMAPVGGNGFGDAVHQLRRVSDGQVLDGVFEQSLRFGGRWSRSWPRFPATQCSSGFPVNIDAVLDHLLADFVLQSGDARRL